MDSDPIFSLESQDAAKDKVYRDKILRVIQKFEDTIRVVEPDPILHKELHAKKVLDAKKEVEEFQEIREDVCATFGVPIDDEHIYIHLPTAVEKGPTLQRAFRAFSVLIDAKSRDAFYGEGRIDHNTLLRNIVELKSKFEEVDFSIDDVFTGIESNPPKYLYFKGFVSKTEDGFTDLTPGSQRVIETPIFDEDGQKIDTPKDWFLTGYNLPASE